MSNFTKNLITGLTFYFLYSPIQAKEYYLSPNGSDNNNGTSITAPFATLEKVISMLSAGDICYIREGEYTPSATIVVKQTGTKENRICLWAYENEKPVINFKNLAATPEDVAKENRGVMHKIGANYWHYKGLTFCNAPDNGMKLEGSFCVVENCVFRNNGDTGLQMGFGKDSKGNNTRNPEFHYGRYNIILNCDSYDNIDVWSNGGDADGFAVKLFPGPGNEFHGCRSWYNSDDGWDFYYTVFPIVVDNCWTMNNGRNKGNGNGFKMGGSNDKVSSYGAHIFTKCISIDNLNKGFDQNNHNEGTYMLNCVSVRNKVNYGFNMAEPANGKWVLRNCIGFGATERNHQFQTNKNTVVTQDTQNCSWTTLDNTNPNSDRDSGTNENGENYTKVINDYTSLFTSLKYDDAKAERQADGQLPPVFGRLAEDNQNRFIDNGVIIENFQTIDSHKAEYEICGGDKNNYGTIVTLPYNGTTADMGAFEYGMPDNEYELKMPENDGSIEEEVPEPSEWEDDNGNLYAATTIIDWYPFQSSVLPDSLQNIIGITGGSIDPSYSDYNNSELCSTGAVKLQKRDDSSGQIAGYMQLNLPSLRELKINAYGSGKREITIMYKKSEDNDWTTVSTTYSLGSKVAAMTDLSSTAMRSKKSIQVRIINSRPSGGGNLQICDLYVSGYRKISDDEDDSGVNGPTLTDYDIYYTGQDIIVYGDIASLQIISPNGKVIASSQNMQVIHAGNLPQGMYMILIKDKNGKQAIQKFIK